ncbi:hypothetical protein AX774_g7159 [Zancudomyces culisetae]|uniref:Uncharacterized protein n=1 Tax=Zancudomyces culisetae TaxID=1213189 RepID=A0A1R1PEP0_ZANCU|nr:hypothetical protein AX774_g7159 [Zancudomyces culisetae]|eukprot:OMH79426.1 hypothetical protein AX774_g7159 [Zancudomyces culisetae]
MCFECWGHQGYGCSPFNRNHCKSCHYDCCGYGHDHKDEKPKESSIVKKSDTCEGCRWRYDWCSCEHTHVAKKEKKEEKEKEKEKKPNKDFSEVIRINVNIVY